jgi:hypothetical protein
MWAKLLQKKLLDCILEINGLCVGVSEVMWGLKVCFYEKKRSQLTQFFLL